MSANLRPSALLAALAVLAFGSGCVEHPSGLPEPEGYDGFLQLGWQAIQQGQYQEAFDWFEQAIDVDVTRSDAYLGAATSCLYLENHWEIADGYFQAAIQQDLGHSAVVRHLNEVQVQDTLWTVFECVDPDLPQESLDVWLPLTADSGDVWVGQQIWDYLDRGGFDTSLEYRFLPGPGDRISCLDLYNAQSGAFYDGDSVSSGYVYLEAPMTLVQVGGIDYYTWIMVGENVGYDYATLDVDASAGQITKDALAGWTMLQQVRGGEGDLLQAAACSQGLLQIAPVYQFGEGDPLREGVFDLDIARVVAGGASYAYLSEKFIYSWFMCKQAGYGLDLDPKSETFLLDLLELFSEMQN
jgi:tetratricopeptide (TPR) repeat protein